MGVRPPADALHAARLRRGTEEVGVGPAAHRPREVPVQADRWRQAAARLHPHLLQGSRPGRHLDGRRPGGRAHRLRDPQRDEVEGPHLAALAVRPHGPGGAEGPRQYPRRRGDQAPLLGRGRQDLCRLDRGAEPVPCRDAEARGPRGKADERRTGADPGPRHDRGPRPQDQELQAGRLLRDQGPGRGGQRIPGHAPRAPARKAPERHKDSPGHARPGAGGERTPEGRHPGEEPGPVVPDGPQQAPAGMQRALRLERRQVSQGHAGSLRAAPGSDLPANRQHGPARRAQGQHPHDRRQPGACRRPQAPSVRREEVRPPAAVECLQRQEGHGPPRDHPDEQGRRHDGPQRRREASLPPGVPVLDRQSHAGHGIPADHRHARRERCSAQGVRPADHERRLEAGLQVLRRGRGRCVRGRDRGRGRR